VAIEQLAHVHKEPVEKAQSIINFLKLSSDEALQGFKVNDRFQTIMLVNKVVDKDEIIRKMKSKSEALQKEIKDIYSLFKPLIYKGMPHFWDVENRLLKKEKFDDLLINKRNGHSNFEDLEGNIRGKVIVVKLGDLFDLLNMAKRINFPKHVVEDYINLELLAIQMMEIVLPTRNHFKELAKMAAKLVEVTPLTL
jgi:hypothetical protein